MKFAKTFCRPSSVVSIVPAGLPLRLQYNEHGLLQKFYIGFDARLDRMYEDPNVPEFDYNRAFTRIKGHVPTTINTTGGTTWVYGVLYTDAIPCDEGQLPTSLYGSYIVSLLAGEPFEFYAGYVDSLAASFNGPLVIKNFLSSNKFDLLPQVVVPVVMTDDTLAQVMRPSGYPFKYEFIAGFFVFEELNCRYASLDLHQYVVTNDIEPEVDSDGFIKGVVETETKERLVFNYSALLHHGVTKGSSILVERDNEQSSWTILSTRVSPLVEKVPEVGVHEIKCPVCGKIISVDANDAPIQCDDPHCLSRLYEDSCKFLTAFDLPTLTFDKYMELVKDKDIICLTDLLELPAYKTLEFKTTMAMALRAIVPVSVVPNFEILERFANKCNHSIETVQYYLDHPLVIETDLDIVDPIIRRFAEWLQDVYNVTSITTLFDRVTIEKSIQKFDGAPIFRGNTIAITGQFKRGSYPEIESILRSYAAEVVPSIELGQKLPDVVIMGSLQTGISGQLIQKARMHNVPIIEEDDFFTQYEIDQDLANNLL